MLDGYILMSSLYTKWWRILSLQYLLPPLQAKYLAPNKEIFNYLQIKHFYKSQFKIDTMSRPSLYEHICLHNSRGKGLLSEICTYLNNQFTSDPLPYRVEWETECSLEHGILNWKDCIDNLKKCTRRVNIRETALKLHTRWYQTPVKIHSIFPTVSLIGCHSPDTFLHLFWECSQVTLIWRKLDIFASKIACAQLSLTPSHCLLLSPITEVTKLQMKLIHTICVAIHWVITIHCKTQYIHLSQINLPTP